jgi:hypothetical protein|tara:strand:- start:9930 stop:10412 length:483 start_codon:yes stop_codon:yes gene_type:complete
MIYKKIILGGIIFIIMVLAIFILDKLILTGEIIYNQETEIVPLSSEDKEKVAQTLLTSEFIGDVPKNNPISLRFYTFQNGERIWRDGFLIGKKQLLSEGKPAVFLYLHSKYIQEFNSGNICETIKKANKNGDLGFYSEHGKTSLLLKYSGMLKHRDCFGL